MGALLVAHRRALGLGLVVVAGLVDLLEGGDGRQHERGPNRRARNAMMRARHDGRRGPGSTPMARSLLLPEPRWRSSTSASRRVHRREVLVLLAAAMARYTDGRVDLPLAVGPVAAHVGHDRGKRRFRSGHEFPLRCMLYSSQADLDEVGHETVTEGSVLVEQAVIDGAVEQIQGQLHVGVRRNLAPSRGPGEYRPPLLAP